MATIHVNHAAVAFDHALAPMVIATMMVLEYGEQGIVAQILIILQSLQTVDGVLVVVNITSMLQVQAIMPTLLLALTVEIVLSGLTIHPLGTALEQKHEITLFLEMEDVNYHDQWSHCK